MCRMKMQRPLFKLWRKIRNCYLNVIFPQIVFWNYPWRVLGCLTKCVSKPRHPFAAQCLRPFLPAKLLLDFQVFLPTLHAWWPDCHQGGMLVGRDGSSVVWKRSDTTRYICALLWWKTLLQREPVPGASGWLVFGLTSFPGRSVP